MLYPYQVMALVQKYLDAKGQSVANLYTLMSDEMKIVRGK
jgi:hypothetical protein